jgi:hypothetical protein
MYKGVGGGRVMISLCFSWTLGDGLASLVLVQQAELAGTCFSEGIL